jgi:hypothetical protein
MGIFGFVNGLATRKSRFQTSLAYGRYVSSHPRRTGARHQRLRRSLGSCAVTTLETLLKDRPAIHGDDGSDPMTHGLIEEGLALLDRSVQPGWRTLETGSGYSTIVLAARGADHTCIVPNQHEVDRIRAYCDGAGIATDRVTFHVEPSERVLPRLDLGALDLVLIDGSHSFPQVFIDWFYTASALKLGGRLIVDDIHVWTGRVLRDFLAAEPAWRIDDELGGRTAILTKIGEVDPDELWTDQPYVVAKSGLGVTGKARMAASMIRHGHVSELAGHARVAVETRVAAFRERRS